MNFESQLAEQVFRSKYLLESESEPDEAVERIVKSVAKVYPEIEEEAREYINKQWFIPAGGIWRAAGNPNQNVSHINCTTLRPVEDNLEDIFNSLYKWAKYAAFGQGEGIDISKLRPRGAKVHNSSRVSTGAVSFMALYDSVLKVIAQQGRRGASLISIRDSHPDIEEFISIKDKHEDDKSRIDTANISIQTTDAFMRTVENDGDWVLHFNNKYEEIEHVIKARDLWNKIINNAHKRADPGLQFIDISKRNSNSDALGYEVTSTNACSEQWLDPENVCNLSHINLAKYLEYGYDGYIKLIKFGIKFLNAVRINEFNDNRSPTMEQKEKLVNLPRIGLGVTGLADYLIDLGISYGSEESIIIAHSLFTDLAKWSYQTGYELGKEYGSFPLYDKIKIKNSDFIKRLLDNNVINEEILEYQFNVCYNTIAPVGSGSLISNCGGSGIEPLYSRYMVRRERSTTKDWKEWFSFNAYVERYLNEHKLDVTKENADELVGHKWVMSFDVNPLDKIKLVSEIQRWIDSAISVTFNMDENCTTKDVEDVYMSAWKSGMKGITVYREGSLSGVLITEKNYNRMLKEKEKLSGSIEQHNAPKRPEDLPCEVFSVKVKEEQFLILVGLYNDEPYEIFATTITTDDNFDMAIKYGKGIIRKKSKGNYSLLVQNGVEKVAIENIGKVFNPDYESLLRLISTSLRHGTPLQFLCDQLTKDKSFVSFGKAISRVLKKYIKEGEKVKSSKVCTNCGSTNLIYQDGCVACADCGSSKCH